jgi:hypothetical protein
MNNLFYLILICIFGLFKGKNPYDYLLEWGLNNSLYISDKLEMRYKSENNKIYYANEEIPAKSIIMNIPFEIMLNIKNALKLLNSKKLNNLYEEYKKDIFNISIGFLPESQDQSFLSYLIYLVNHRQKHYKKNKFYQYFHYLLDTFETNLDSFPVFYNKNQLQLLQGSMALMEIRLMKELYKEEVDKFEHKHKQKEIDFDEYLRFRTLTITKSLNISNHTSIIPFIDMFANDPIDFNVNFKLNETNNNLYVFTTKNIKRGDILYIRSGYFSNNKRFVLYGETFDKMKDYIEAFQIPLISAMMHHRIPEKGRGYDLDDTIDLVSKNFYKEALSTYKKISVLKRGDGSDISGYKLFLQNLELVRGTYDHVTSSNIHNEFLNLKDINNVIRVLEFEKKFLDEKINVLRKFIDKLEKKSSNKSDENEKNKDL